MEKGKCSRCGHKILMMCRKGTKFCSTNCAEKRAATDRERDFAIAA